ncbi:MAG: thiol:disulfide interchange protein DsbA/DsbL [Gammaproteobacteria bacterium]|nr:thiol:disulfide interchange protein DsbA/DsbL [Gammaproteobacteria bacterium]MBV9317177.1 thiol:disulfide interchange protein DsbA/DsbL [Gammaproteobacteria bacterium]MBV9726241.1 thiol:disulfide interchange protein DsbA/DsbL [Gammaproteobacteria bacterium]
MPRRTAPLLLTLTLVLLSAGARAATWTEGVQYVRIVPPQATSVPHGKVEVLEVFSYGCPACNAFQPVMEKLRHALPANAQLAFLPAAFNPGEDWPMFQRAFFAAQALGVAERAHQAMFDAVWKTGELGITQPGTNRLKNPLPSIADAARFYARVAGVDPQKFLAMANSFGVDSKMRAADAQIVAMHVDSTPTLVVNGKYRVIRDELKGDDELIELVRYLVGRESGG